VRRPAGDVARVGDPRIVDIDRGIATNKWKAIESKGVQYPTGFEGRRRFAQALSPARAAARRCRPRTPASRRRRARR
jgi:hypothetical protein